MEEKNLILALGFNPKENTSGILQKQYEGYAIEIDFEKKQFHFGEKIKAGRETTQNFSQPENWVILECVDRLLEKGYKPENIVLEKKYTVGHGASGGWLDILVTREDGSAYLMIECKTWGKEFEKEFKNLEKNGGQLFTYFQQDKSADILMLYASKLEGTKVRFRNEIIKIEDHYRQAGNVEDVYDRWNKVTNTNGIFDEWVKPYLFESKKLTKKDLKPLNEEDSRKIFHEFLSILRKHSVSDKPNAFNVIFDLFLSKLWDEKKEDNEELSFQWREKEDDAVSFQYRLLGLYRDGMDDFLKKEVFGLNDNDFNADTPEALNIIRKKVLMLEKVFNIKSVIDEASFEDNQKVLKEVVQLLQKYKIRYPRKQQHLSDFFERLLTTGLKQEVGQFFTPPPITRFIIKSLPLEQMLIKAVNQKSPELPAMIDYAAGSGHFLTEIMEEYQSIINAIDISNFKTDAKKKVQAWRLDEYEWASKYIYGIDKDYRLVKVAKVGCYFYGDGLAQVIHGDGLGNFENAKPFRGLIKENAKKPQFQLVLSNPPYSVSAFKTTLNATYAKEDFKLFDKLTDRSSEIECLFIERTKQLLKIGGIAAIVLPSSILSNSGIYAKAREIILKAFDMVAITELGSNTFMATGTNTVTLFLKRREDTIAEEVEKSLTTVFTNLKDITINGIEKPIAKYVAHVWEAVSFSDYTTLLRKEPNEAIKQHEIFKAYDKKIKAGKEEDKWTQILAVEKEKLLYFILSFNQKVVLVKTGQKAKEKQFLGYEFSNRRGSEGIHPIQRSKTIDACTQLYDTNTFDNPNKASTYIYKAFTENKFDLQIPEILKENLSYHNLVDMLTFDRVDFEKNIVLSAKKKVKIESKWEETILDNIASFQSGLWTGKKGQLKKIKVIRNTNFKLNNGKLSYDDIAEINVEENQLKTRQLEYGDIILEKSGGSDTQAIGRVVLFDKKENEAYSFSNFCSRIRVLNKEMTNPIYLWLFLNKFYDEGGTESLQNGVRLLNIDLTGYKRIKIPLPPLNIQQKIVYEIEVLEQQERKAVEEIEELKSDISNFINELYRTNDTLKLKEIISINSKSTNPKTTYKNKYFTYIDIDSLENGTGKIAYNKKVLGNEAPSRAKRIAENDSTIISTVRPYLRGFAYIENVPNDVIFSTGYAILNSKDNSKYLTRLLYYFFMYSDNLMKQMQAMMPKAAYPSINKSDIESLKLPAVKIEKQIELIDKFKQFELKITELENQTAAIPKQKEAILKKYLE